MGLDLTNRPLTHHAWRLYHFLPAPLGHSTDLAGLNEFLGVCFGRECR